MHCRSGWFSEPRTSRATTSISPPGRPDQPFTARLWMDRFAIRSRSGAVSGSRGRLGLPAGRSGRVPAHFGYGPGCGPKEDRDETDNEGGAHARDHGEYGGDVGGGGRQPGISEDLPAAEHSPAVYGSGQRRHAGRQHVRAAPRSHHRAQQLLRDYRGEQGRRRGRHRHLRADRGQPPARPDHARPVVRVRRRHHREPHQGRNVQLHRQGDRRGPDRHDGLPDHRHRARPARPVALQRRQRQLPDQRGLRAAGCRLRPSPTKGTCPPATTPAARSASSLAPCPRGYPCPPPSGPPATSSAAPPPPLAPTTSPCKAPATRASPCIRPTRSRWIRTRH